MMDVSNSTVDHTQHIIECAPPMHNIRMHEAINVSRTTKEELTLGRLNRIRHLWKGWQYIS